jgi:PAS domain S-box-containing protein
MADAVTMPLFAAMMDNTDDYIYFKDRNHVVTGASQTLVALCAPASHWTDLLGQTDYDIFPEEYADIYYKLEKQIFASVSVAHEIQKTLTKDGKEGWVDNRKYPIRDASGVLVGLYGIARDITPLKQTEASLLASEAKARAIIDSSPVPIALNDSNQRITYLNRAFTQTFGYDLKDIPALTEWWRQAYPDPAYRQEVNEGWQVKLARSQATGAAFEPMEVTIRCKDGTERIALASAAMFAASAEDLHLVSLHDITAQKQAEAVLRRENAAAERMRRALLSAAEDKLQAEKALHETNDRLYAVMENLSEGLIVGDDQGQTIYWNPAALALNGYADMQDCQRHLAEYASTFEMRLLNEERPLSVADWPLNRALRGERLHNLAIRLRRLDQGWEKIIAYSGWLIHRPSGEKIVFISATDISERMQAEEKTRQSLAALELARQGLLNVVEEQRKSAEQLRKLSAIIEQAPLSVVITDLNGVIEYVNPRFCLVTGYTAAEAIGQNPRILKSGETPPEVYRAMWDTLTRGEVWTGALSNRTKGGEAYLENVIIAPVVDAQGQATHFIALKDDITAKKRHEEEMTAKLAREHELSEMKTRFISVTSHEFRTPMAAAMGSVEILANHHDRLAAEKRQVLLARINSSLKRMTEMLDEILLVNRMDANRVEVRFATIDLQSFVHQTMEEIRLGDRDAHRFEFQVTGVARDFPSDTNLLHHILSNLLSNAVRYSPAGTAITVRLLISAEQAQVAVEDRGIGIPESDYQRIFEPFERGSNVGTIKGTGLGLNIVQKMTALLGGNVALTAVEGGGSRFTVTLPRPQLPPPAS